MVDFRRCITALALLALFVGLAGAQVTSSQLQCQTNVAVTPTMRAEGYTEQTGDLILTCTGGSLLAPGAIIPQVNIALTYSSPAVTSRLFSTAPNISEALLLLDEPGSGLVGYGPGLAQKLCTTPTTGCVEYVGTVAGATLGTPVDSCVTVGTGICTTTSSTFGPNVFQGVVVGNQVTFFGVPILAPVTAGNTRVIRVTNVRVNAIGGGTVAGPTPVSVSVSTNGATSLGITNANPVVGFIQNGLTASASGSATQNQCSSANISGVTQLTFTENFPTAFKTRIFAASNTQYAGQGVPSAAAPGNQNVPGAIYNSESNFVFPIGSSTAGLADFGTRLKATFLNVPAGVRIFVSTININNLASPFALPALVGGSAQNTVAPIAQLVTSATAPDNNTTVSAGFFPSVPGSAFGPAGSGNVPIAEILPINGVYTAVWEVVNTNPNTNETLKFAVYDTYTANVNAGSPPAGSPATVALSFAPSTAPSAASTTPSDFGTANAALASSTLVIPRFIGDQNAKPGTIITINVCRTVLLYPYVINVQGFDTGLSIANTSNDSGTGFTTSPQTGSCKLNWYQGTTNPPQGDTGTIPPGTIWASNAGVLVPGFNGYMIAVCNFQFAHGFAFVSDVGARNIAMGYLAVVIPDVGTGARSASLVASGQGTGEILGH